MLISIMFLSRDSREQCGCTQSGGIFWKEEEVVLFQEQLSNFSGKKKSLECRASQTEWRNAQGGGACSISRDRRALREAEKTYTSKGPS